MEFRVSLLFVLTGCGLHHQVDDEVDFGPAPDAGVELDAGALDAPVVERDPELCELHEFMGCSFATLQWFWDGSDCVSLTECAGIGAPTRASCLRAHSACGAEEVCMAGAEVHPSAACLRDGVVYSDLPSTIYLAHECGEMDCLVDANFPYIDLSVCGRDSGACAVAGRSVPCQIPALWREDEWIVRVNGVERFEVMSYDSRIALERGCFCGDGTSERFDTDIERFVDERGWDGLLATWDPVFVCRREE